jgi:dihydrofolate reductase
MQPQPPPRITLIAALDRHRAIGRGGAIPWDLPDDVRHFVRATRGKPVIMGRKTWDSLWIKPLPKRLNVVLSRSPSLTLPEGVLRASTPTEALALSQPTPEVMVIGGGDIYSIFLPYASRLILTHIDADIPNADAFFPPIDPSTWAATDREDHPTDPRHAHPFSILTYARTSTPSPLPTPA